MCLRLLREPVHTKVSLASHTRHRRVIYSYRLLVQTRQKTKTDMKCESLCSMIYKFFKQIKIEIKHKIIAYIHINHKHHKCKNKAEMIGAIHTLTGQSHAIIIICAHYKRALALVSRIWYIFSNTQAKKTSKILSRIP